VGSKHKLALKQKGHAFSELVLKAKNTNFSEEATADKRPCYKSNLISADIS
jgi:hypothetical protein